MEHEAEVEPVRRLPLMREPRANDRSRAHLFVLTGICASAAAVRGSWWMRVLALVLGSAALWTIRRARRKRSEALLLIDSHRITLLRPGQDRQTVLDLRQPFGVVLLANSRRTRLVMAITAPQRVLYVGTHVALGARREHRDLLAEAFTLSDDEEALHAMGQGGEGIDLSLENWQALLHQLTLHPERMGSVWLTDTRGDRVVLCDDELRIGAKIFDLQAPLDWRSLVFQEALGSSPYALSEGAEASDGAAGVLACQGTWVRQGAVEVVLVSQLASLESSAHSTPVGVPEIERAIARDARLNQAKVESPPPSDLRVGIERVFMMPLRAALDRAHRKSRRDVTGRLAPAKACP